jgi:23S rRNA (pseudouridine1915-N3)-methyltransferase
MKINIVTVGQPRLKYAQEGWGEYYGRLGHYHQLRTTRIQDKHDDAKHILAATEGSYSIGLVIDGQQFSSPQLAAFLDKKALEAKEVSFIIGGPDGFPAEVIEQLDYRWSLGKLTLPHDLAMVVTLEALYRASTINAGRPYHRA